MSEWKKNCPECGTEVCYSRKDGMIRSIKENRRCRSCSKCFPVKKRFFERFTKTDTCWIWTGKRNEYGYGVISVKGKWNRAHRLSWKLYCGEIPNGMCVLHKCDNPPCVNPEHLFLGTKKDNSDDREKKQRGNHSKGEQNHSILTNEDVLLIRNSPRYHKMGEKLGKHFGVSRNTIFSIRSNKKTWRHLNES